MVLLSAHKEECCSALLLLLLAMCCHVCEWLLTGPRRPSFRQQPMGVQHLYMVISDPLGNLVICICAVSHTQ